MSFLVRCGPIALALLCVAHVYPQSAPTPTLTIRGAGVAPKEADAKKAALENVLNQALEIVLDAPTRAKHKAAIAEKILPKAAELIKDFEVLKTEKIAEGKISVRVKATVDRSVVVAKLLEAGVLTKEDLTSSELAANVVKFCKDNLGKKIGDGECGTLAVEAMKSAGAKPFYEYKENPGQQDFVWGELVFLVEVVDGKRKRHPADAKPKPGDVIQYRDSTFRSGGGIYLFPHHTAVIAEVKASGELVVYEQNMQGKKEVTRGTLRPNELSSGWIRVYRPVTK